jgi:hypothetical protein
VKHIERKLRQTAAAPALQFVDENVAAQVLDTATQTLRNWRVSGRGPVFHKFGRSVRYEIGDLYDYARSRRRRSTSEAA